MHEMSLKEIISISYEIYVLQQRFLKEHLSVHIPVKDLWDESSPITTKTHVSKKTHW